MFKYKKPVPSRLTEYGFIRENSALVYHTEILSGEFVLKLCVTDGSPAYRVFDSETGDEYTLVHNENAQGAFVGSVRAECERVLSDIAKKCYVTDVFANFQTKAVIAHNADKYGVIPDFPFADSPDAAIFRKPSGKWYGIIMVVGGDRVGLPAGTACEVMNLKAPPETVARLISENTVLQAYHMNKKHWLTVLLDGTLPLEKIYELIEISYKTVK